VLNWEIFGEDLLWLEIYASCAFLAVLGGWIVFRKLPMSRVALLVTGGLVAIGGFRGFDYNSDTMNYYSYVYLLSFVNDSEIFFLTKLEPVHSALILIFRDFRIWLLAECIIQVIGLILSYRVRRNDFSFLLLCAFVLTLSTSALRYCSALIYFYYFLSRSEVNLVKAARMTVILSCFHITMLLSGALAVRKRLVLIAISAVCIGIFFESSVLGARIDIDLTEASRGFKNFGVAIMTIAYLFFRAPRKGLRYLPLYTAAFMSIFLISALVLPTFNRFLIMGALTVLVNEWVVARGDDESDIFDRGFTFGLASAVILPYVINLPRLYYSGAW
jgi:hypothetical protein